MKVKTPGLRYYVDRINSGKPFSFVRYGDGEWTAAFLHDRPRTSSGSQTLKDPQLRRDMYRSVVGCHRAGNYVVALRQSSLIAQPRVESWLMDVAPWIRWHDCTVFYKASRKGMLHPFVKALRNLEIPLVIVGPERLRGLRRIFPGMHFVGLRGRDCYVDKDKIMARVVAANHPCFFSFTAGPAAKVMIHQLFPLVGSRSFLFDLGSLWDVYVGRRTRQYHKRMTPDIIRRNLTGK